MINRFCCGNLTMTKPTNFAIILLFFFTLTTHPHDTSSKFYAVSKIDGNEAPRRLHHLVQFAVPSQGAHTGYSNEKMVRYVTQ